MFTKVLKPVFANLGSQFGYSCLGYIDDSFYIEDTLHRCQEATLHAVELSIMLGYVVHPTKNHMKQNQPAQIVSTLYFPTYCEQGAVYLQNAGMLPRAYTAC